LISFQSAKPTKELGNRRDDGKLDLDAVSPGIIEITDPTSGECLPILYILCLDKSRMLLELRRKMFLTAVDREATLCMDTPTALPGSQAHCCSHSSLDVTRHSQNHA